MNKKNNKISCELSYLERVRDNYSKHGMMYKFLNWLTKKNKIEYLEIPLKQNQRSSGEINNNKEVNLTNGT
jgi:hypothetical protein